MKVQERIQLLRSLQSRFEKNMPRHRAVAWETVLARLEASPTALKSLGQMEASGGEPDVTGQDKATGKFVFCDCSLESPPGRRSLCYDREALNARKENKPEGSAVEMALSMGVDLLTEAQYRVLQQLGEFDTKTSSWIATPQDVRSLGGALFCDRRYGKVFVYHNGAQSVLRRAGLPRPALRVSWRGWQSPPAWAATSAAFARAEQWNGKTGPYGRSRSRGRRTNGCRDPRSFRPGHTRQPGRLGPLASRMP